jgi:thioredoxin reductase
MLKEDLVDLWKRLAEGLRIDTGVTVKIVHKAGDGFALETDRYGYHARRVILAIGRRGIPRKLGVPGEDLDNVQYALAEPEAFGGDRVLVVGGGDSAIEAALAVSDVPGTKVRISYRRDAFGRIKPGNRARLDAALASGAVELLLSTNVSRIEHERVWLTGNVSGDAARPIDNDQVLIFAGGELPTAFLRECGVEIETKFGTS